MKRLVATCLIAATAALPFANVVPIQGWKAPGWVGNHWLNTTLKQGVNLNDGKVTIVHFWTLGCINCKRNLPAYNRWRSRFAERDVQIVGIHTPETDYERDPAHVRTAIRKQGIRYPVLLDAGEQNWNRWHQRFWPAVYLVDRHGNVRYQWDGELNSGGQTGEAQLGKIVERLVAEK